MRRMGIGDMWRGAADRAVSPRARVYGRAGGTVRQRFSGVVSTESLFRLFLAFLLATILWLYVNSRNPPNASFPYSQPIPVAAENVPAGLTVRNIIQPIHVSCGPGIQCLSLPPSSFAATINLTGLRPGTHVHVPVQLVSDPSFRVSYRPHSIAVVLDRLASKTVPVRIHVVSPLPFGYALRAGTLTSTPEKVTVSGPKSFVDEVGSAAVFMRLGSAKSSINLSFVPQVENAQGQALPAGRLSVSPGHVRVRATVMQLASFKTLPIIASLSGQPAPGFGITSIQENPAGLTAYGSPRVLSSVQRLRTTSVRVSNLHGGRKIFTVGLVVPDGVYTPRTRIRVTIVVGSVTGEASTRLALVPLNLKSGYDVSSVSPGSVLVLLSGPSPVLSSRHIRARATIDLRGLRSGRYRIKPHVTGHGRIVVESIDPRSVFVTIRRAHG